jgi:hypothetical protein
MLSQEIYQKLEYTFTKNDKFAKKRKLAYNSGNLQNPAILCYKVGLGTVYI